MNYTNLLFEIVNNVAHVTINRPDKLNALNNATLNELYEVFLSIEHNPEVRAVVLTGSGEKAFVAGADISELNKLTPLAAKDFAEKGQKIFSFIEHLSKPVIAAVNGFALGGGCELALACHIRLTSENAKFGQPEINLGIIPGYGGTQRLTRLINSSKALEYILTADFIDAQTALQLGLVNHVYPLSELITAAKELAEKIAAKPAQAVRLALKAIHAIKELPQSQGEIYEASLFALATGTEDFKEGTTAFLQKRKPDFTHK
ncbi:MAG: enoyl-CoA hydratase-related protein [Ignavibacteriaceae bacterium]|jgi:enoyl-CoA hydratase